MGRRAFGLILVAITLAAGPDAQNLQRPAPAGLLMGVVVDSLDGQPVADSEVTLGGAPLGMPNTKVLTDGEGRFVFMDLPSGTYTITATKPGYAEGAFGRRRAMGLSQSLSLAEAERIGDIKIPLWKFAVITGRVTDDAGDPMVSISVRVMQRIVVAGKRKLMPGAIARTDDRGIYRIASLIPGDYVVGILSTQVAAPQSIVDSYRQSRLNPGGSGFYRDASFSGAMAGLNLFEGNSGTSIDAHAFHSTLGLLPTAAGDSRMFVYPTQYYPAAQTAADATAMTLRSGEERAGIDLSLKLVPTSRVSGRVTGPDGPLVAALTLAPESDDVTTDAGLETATTMSDAGGRFTFLGVPAGRYRLTAVWVQVPANPGASRGAPPPATAVKAAPLPVLGGFTLSATQTIAVGATDIGDLAITVRAGFRIGGRAEFAGSAAQPAPDAVRRMSATFDPADGRPLVSVTVGRGQFDDQGVLSSYQLPPGRYYLRINNPPPGWTLKGATVNGRDISNVPLTLDRDVTGVTVTFTDRPSSLAGQVQSASSAADSSATVLIFPADAAAWIDYGSFPHRLRAVRVDPEGRYRTAGLPAGEYLVVAVADESSANFQDPDVLKTLARLATPVVLGDGESRSVALKTTAVSR